MGQGGWFLWAALSFGDHWQEYDGASTNLDKMGFVPNLLCYEMVYDGEVYPAI